MRIQVRIPRTLDRGKVDKSFNTSNMAAAVRSRRLTIKSKDNFEKLLRTEHDQIGFKLELISESVGELLLINSFFVSTC